MVRDLDLSKQAAEVLASTLNEKHVLHSSAKVSFYRKRDELFLPYCKEEKQLVCRVSVSGLLGELGIPSSDGIQGVRTGSREPVLAMPGYSANPCLLFVIDLLIHAAILSEPVLTFCYSS